MTTKQKLSVKICVQYSKRIATIKKMVVHVLILLPTVLLCQCGSAEKELVEANTITQGDETEQSAECVGYLVPKICESYVELRGALVIQGPNGEQYPIGECRENICVPFCNDENYSPKPVVRLESRPDALHVYLRDEYPSISDLPDDHISDAFFRDEACVARPKSTNN